MGNCPNLDKVQFFLKLCMKSQDFVITLRMSHNLITPTVIAPLSIQVLKKLLLM